MSDRSELLASKSPALQGQPSLALPFAVLGTVGGWLTADAFRVGGEESLRWPLCACTPLVSAGLGRFLSSRLPPLRSRPFTLGLAVVASILAAGVVNGGLVGFFVAPPLGPIVGLVLGLICAVPFIPALAAVVLVARRIGRARQGSIVDRADRRAVWLVTFTVPAMAAALARPDYAAPGSFAVLSMVSAVLVPIPLALDLGAWARLRKEQRRSADARAWAPEQGDPAGGTFEVIDFGLGDAAVQEVAPARMAYRDRERLVRVFHGSAARADAALRWALALDAAALALVLGNVLARPSDVFDDARAEGYRPNRLHREISSW